MRTMATDNSAVPRYPELLQMKDRVFVVIGAGQGIGRQVAHALSQHGANVICVGRGHEATQSVAKEIGGLAFVGDAQRRGDVERLYEETRRNFGRLDGILDTVAIGIGGSVQTTTDEDFQWQHDNVLRHAFLALQLGAPLMRSSGGGSVVFVGSLAGLRVVGGGGAMAYGTFKAALEHFARIAAAELGPMGIRVNTTTLGFIRTPRYEGLADQQIARISSKIPLRRVGESTEVASAILFLLSDMASHITGASLVIDGGFSIASDYPTFEQSEGEPSGWDKADYQVSTE